MCALGYIVHLALADRFAGAWCAATGKAITPEFYSLFWSLSMQDLYVPHDLYTENIKKLNIQVGVRHRMGPARVMMIEHVT